MSYNDVIAFNAAMQQAQDTQKNLQSIQDARENHENDMEKFALAKKQAQLDIDKDTMSNQFTSYELQAREANVDQYMKSQQDQLDGNKAKIDQAEYENVMQGKQAVGVAQHLIQNSPDVQNHVAQAFNMAQQQPGASAPTDGGGQASAPMSLVGGGQGPDPTMTASAPIANAGQNQGQAPVPNTADAYKNSGSMTLPGPQGSMVVGGDQSNQGAIAPANTGSLFGMQGQQGGGGGTAQVQPQTQQPAQGGSQSSSPQASNNQPLPPLKDLLQGMDNNPYGSRMSDYNMPNPNFLTDGKMWAPKDPAIINSENPLHLSPQQQFVEEHAKDLIKKGYSVDEVLSQLPSDTAETVKQIASYQGPESTLLGGMQATPQTRAAYMGLIRKINPTYNSAKYGTAQTYYKDLGEDSGNHLGSRVVAVNTVASHLSMLNDVANQLQSNNLPAGNAIINFVRTQLGHPEVTNFDQAREIVSNEVQNLLSSKGATQSGVKRMEEGLNPNMSGAQLSDWVKKTTTPLVAERVQALRSQYKQNTGLPDSGDILYPETRQQFTALMGRDVFSQYDQGKNPFSKANQPQQSNTDQNINIPAGRVGVMGPDGKKYSLPQEQLQQAMQQGYKKI